MIVRYVDAVLRATLLTAESIVFCDSCAAWSILLRQRAPSAIRARVLLREHYNEHRPHRSLKQRPPLPRLMPTDEQRVAEVIDLDRIRRRDLLGSLIHEYQLVA